MIFYPFFIEIIVEIKIAFFSVFTAESGGHKNMKLYKENLNIYLC